MSHADQAAAGSRTAALGLLHHLSGAYSIRVPRRKAGRCRMNLPAQPCQQVTASRANRE